MGSATIRKEWEGLTVDGKFALLEWLGGTVDHGFFLTIRLGTVKSAIKLIRAEGAEADAYLAQWEAAKSLSHTHLMPIYEYGRCVLEGVSLVYVITEHADRVLSQFVQQRALAPDETRDILSPIFNALGYLHAQGCVHGHVKPSNVLIVEDELKLSTDDLLVLGEIRKAVKSTGPYDAPELVAGTTVTPAADVWSLGMTVTEALTQRLPDWDPATGLEPALPRFMPQPFPTLVQDCLRIDPAQRRKVEELTVQLATLSRRPPTPEAAPEPEPAPAAPPPVRQQPPQQASQQHPQQHSQQGPPAPPIARDLFPAADPSRSAAQARVGAREPSPFAWQEAPPAPQTFGRGRSTEPRYTELRYADPQHAEPYHPNPGPTPAIFAHIDEEPPPRRTGLWLVLGTALVFGIAGVALVKTGIVTVKWPPAIQNAIAPAQPVTQPAGQPAEQPGPSPTSTEPKQAAAPATASTAPAQTQPSPTQSTSTPSSDDDTQSSAATPSKARTDVQPVSQAAQSAPPADISSSAPATRAEDAPGDVAKRVLPNVSPAAAEGMRGPVLVEIRVHVSKSGSVESATYMTSGPGNYFGKISQRAAEGWKFDPPMRHGRAEPSVWLLRFSYFHGRADVTATPEGAE
jgi:serine/threonine protein kinase